MTPSTGPEAIARRDLIDPQLVAAGWEVRAYEPGVPIPIGATALTEYPTRNGPADYALCYNGWILATVEAKKPAISPDGRLGQAERYALGAATSPLRFGAYYVPFVYATNGAEIWFRDARSDSNLSREVRRFHTPRALQEMLERDRDDELRRLMAWPNEREGLRGYQADANVAVERAIREGKRRMLVAMATGTGKTYTTVNQVYRLIKSGVARRVLFLVDRRALAAQAVREFKSFEAEPGKKFHDIYEVYSSRFQREEMGDDATFDPTVMPRKYLEEPQTGHAFVYVCTVQRMAINLFGRGAAWHDEEGAEDDDDRLDLPIHAFDLVIADECHRGYTANEESLWRETLSHFDAVTIGLTATPALHTLGFFKMLAYRYDYEQAVRDGYLVDYDVVNVRSAARMDGVFLDEGAAVELVDVDRNGTRQLDFLEDQRRFDAAQLEVKVTAPDANRKILEELKRYTDAHEAAHGRFPKTLIFAANDREHASHAQALVHMAREIFGRGEKFVEKITGKADRPLQRIKEFRNEAQPGIAVTVDLLSTGVDIPDLEFIVMLRPLRSRILFEQMLGRGTRRSRNFAKTHFTVFDCFDGTLMEYFREVTGITAEPPAPSTRTLAEVVDDIWRNRDRAYNTGVLVKRLQRVDREIGPEDRDLLRRFLPPGLGLGEFARDLPRALRGDFDRTMSILRDGEFQALLTGYRRPSDRFVIAIDYSDTVTSAAVFRDAGGNAYRPGDYLDAFARFVRENPDQIEAIRILQERPADWSVAVLKELRERLASSAGRFTEENLRLAHRSRYNVALADIISMVKHAANEAAPLLSAEERVESAFRRLTAGRDFTAPQQRWLDYIREHLVQNLSIDRADFDLVPVLADRGGWGPADRAFEGKLAPLLNEINEAIAA